MEEEITSQKLKIAYFFITKKRLLRKIFLVLFIIFDLAIWSYFLSHLILYLHQNKDYQIMEKELLRLVNINYEELHKNITPLIPEVVYHKAIFLGNNRYHLICLLRNPNRHWYANFEYYFSWSNGSTPSSRTFLLPNEEKFLVVFNQRINESVFTPHCQIEKIQWQRIRHDRDFLLEIPKQFLIKDLKHFSAQQRDERDMTTFKFVNSTIYNFWQIDLIILLYQGQEVVGVERKSLKEIFSQEEREVKIIWPSSFSFVSEIKIVPQVDVFAPSSFIPPTFKLKKD